MLLSTTFLLIIPAPTGPRVIAQGKAKRRPGTDATKHPLRPEGAAHTIAVTDALMFRRGIRARNREHISSFQGFANRLGEHTQGGGPLALGYPSENATCSMCKGIQASRKSNPISA